MNARTLAMWGCTFVLATASCSSDDDGTDDCAGSKCDDLDGDGVDDDLSPLDVAFLIRPSSSPNVTPIRPSEITAAGTPLMANEGFFDFLSEPGREFHAGPGGTLGMPANPYDSLAVTGVRYDPCSPEQFTADATPISGDDCLQELRLVVQPIVNGSAVDAAIHLIYSLSPEEGAAVRESLHAIKASCDVDTTNVSVGPHPCLDGLDAGDADASRFLDEQLRPMILRHANPSNLGGAATMVTVRPQQQIEWHWRLFFKNPLTGNLRQAASLPNTTSNVAVFRQDGALSPVPTTLMNDGGVGALGTRVLQFITGEQAPSDPNDPDHVVAPEELRAGILSAYMLENPRLSSLPVREFVKRLFLSQSPVAAHVDCASCHIQSPALTIFEGAKADLIEGLAAEIEAVRFPSELEHLAETRQLHEDTLIPGRTNYVVINFGFLGRSASVNRRVANEAEDTARYIKEVLQ